MRLGTAGRQRILVEDALKHLLDCELGGGVATADSVAGALGWRRARATEVLVLLKSRGLARPDGDGWKLSEDGRQYAMQIVRTHRCMRPTWRGRPVFRPRTGTGRRMPPSTRSTPRGPTSWPTG
jgi:hypothetical protein